jgi:hypothetical protein
VPDQFALVVNEELLQKATYCRIGAIFPIATICCFFNVGPIVTAKGQAIVLISGKGNRTDTGFIETQREGPDVTSERWVLMQRIQRMCD